MLLLSLGLVSVCANAQVKATPLQTRPDFGSTPKLPDWDRYTVRGGEFSVLLPTAPAMSTYEKRPDRLTKVRLRHIIGAYSQGVVYAIYVYQRDAPLDEFIAEHSPEQRGYTRDLKIGEFAGKEYVVQTAETKSVVQYFITKRYIYSFVALGSYLRNPEAGMTRFFDSIKFESSDNDIAIVDGAGIQSSVDPGGPPDPTDVQVFSGKNVNRKTIVVNKPEPSYTEAARKSQTMGTVVIRCVFSSSGAVTNLTFVSGLPDGLSERAMAAAKQIRFVPAIKDGRFVSMYIQLEYNFNLY